MHKIVKIAVKAFSIALLVFGKSNIEATAFTWDPLTTNPNLVTPTNWNPNGIPTVGDTASFGPAKISAVNFQFSTPSFQPDQITFLPGTPINTVNVGPVVFPWLMDVTGFTNSTSCSMLPTCPVSIDIGNFGILVFAGSASAMTSTSTGFMQYNLSTGSLEFTQNSTAGGSSIGGPLINVTVNAILSFSDSSTGGTAQITLATGGQLTTDHGISVTSVSSDSSSMLMLGGPLTLNQTTQQTIAGLIEDNITPGSIIDQGAGLLTISGAGNTYTGGTQILSGATIQVNNPGNLGTGNVTFNNGALQFGSSFTLPNNIVLTGNGTMNNLGNDDTLSGLISGAGGLISEGSGTLTLLPGNTYSGTTTIKGGTVSISNDSALGSPATGIIFNGPGATLEMTSDVTSERSVTLTTAGTFNTTTTTDTFNGVISGPGQLIVAGTGGTLILTENNTYTGGNNIMPTNTLQGTTRSIIGNVLDNGTLVLNQTFSGTFGGVISGSGAVVIDTMADITFTGNNSYAGPTFLDAGILSVSSDSNLGAPTGSLVFNGGPLQFLSGFTTARPVTLNSPGGTIDTQANTDTMTGNFTGTGALTKVGSGTLILTGTNNYIGGTSINNGTLEGNSSSLQGSINDLSALIFNQTTNGTFNGTVSGPGTITKIGAGVLTMNTNSGSFTGTTTINQGGIALNALLGGDVIDNSSFSGTGTVGGNVIVNSEGTISGGNNGVGNLNVAGNFTQNPGSINAVFINGSTNNLINVSGTANLNGGEVAVTANGINLNETYTILHANGGVDGVYMGVFSTNGGLIPTISYDPDDVLLNFRQGFLDAAVTPNQFQAAQQLLSITNPTPAQQALLNQLSSLPISEIQTALSQLSGELYTDLYVLAENTSNQFVRMLYDPLRSVLNVDPRCRCACSRGMSEVWVGGGAGHTTYNSGQFVSGLGFKTYEVGAGIQSSAIWDNWTVGLAGYYEHDKVHFTLGGTDKVQSGFGGVYGLYSPSEYYVLADIVVGNSSHRFRRNINVGTISLVAQSSPNVIQTSGYLEIGADKWLGVDSCWMNALALQPFVGFGAGVYVNNQFTETGADPVNLEVESQTNGSAYTRLGMHLTALDIFRFFDVSLDAAWQWRLSSQHYDINAEFVGFGNGYPLQGFVQDMGFFDGCLSVAAHVDNWDFYVEGRGAIGNQIWSYTYAGGLGFRW